MGLHISIYNKDGDSHSEWDWIRMGGDRDVPSVLYSVPHTENDHDGCRPDNVEAFRLALRQKFGEMNEDRWEQMCDILTDPQWFLHFGY